MVVVNTEDATLVMHKDKAEEVKDLVEFLKANGQKQLT